MPFKNLLVPVDFSETSKEALRLAIQLARAGKGSLTLLHVGLSPIVYQETWLPESGALFGKWRDQLATEQMHALNRLAREEIPEDVPWRAQVEEGFPPEVIVREARVLGADLIVMGTHGRTGLERVLVGSVAERVLRASPVPVLSVR